MRQMRRTASKPAEVLGWCRGNWKERDPCNVKMLATAATAPVKAHGLGETRDAGTHINAAVIMMADKIADIIRECSLLPTSHL
jgi:hypothetical protein